MATLKIIANAKGKLYVDQEFVCDLYVDKLTKYELQTGEYLVDVVLDSNIDIKESFDLHVVDAQQQILKRVSFCTPRIEDEELSFVDDPTLLFQDGLARVCRNGKYGFIDSTYNIVIPIIFSNANHFVNGICLVESQTGGVIKKTFINKKGELLLGLWFDRIIKEDLNQMILLRDDEVRLYDKSDFSCNRILKTKSSYSEGKLIPINDSSISNLWGYANESLEFILPSIYEDAEPFSDSGFAEVQRFGVRSFIDQTGKVYVMHKITDNPEKVILGPVENLRCPLDCQYEWCGKLEIPNSESYFLGECVRFPVRKNGKWGYAYLKKTNNRLYSYELIDCIHERVMFDSRNEYIIVRNGNKNQVLCILEDCYRSNVDTYIPKGQVMFEYECDELYPIDDHKRPFWFEKTQHEIGKFVFRRGERWGICDVDGTSVFCNGVEDIYIKNLDGISSHANFKADRLLTVVCRGKKGLISSRGDIVVPCIFEELFFDHGMWYTMDSEGCYHVLDINTGIESIFSFDSIRYRKTDYKDVCFIEKKGRKGLLRADGLLLLDCLCDSIELKCYEPPYTEGALYSRGGKYGFVSIEGVDIIPCEYDSIQCVEADAGFDYPSTFFVEKGGKYGLWTIEGKIMDTIADKIESIDYPWFFRAKRGAMFALVHRNRQVTDHIYQEITRFEDEVYDCHFIVKKNNLYGLIDHSGNEIIPIVHSDSSEVQNQTKFV